MNIFGVYRRKFDEDMFCLIHTIALFFGYQFWSHASTETVSNLHGFDVWHWGSNTKDCRYDNPNLWDLFYNCFVSEVRNYSQEETKRDLNDLQLQDTSTLIQLICIIRIFELTSCHIIQFGEIRRVPESNFSLELPEIWKTFTILNCVYLRNISILG